jgi:hypothetical protein
MKAMNPMQKHLEAKDIPIMFAQYGMEGNIVSTQVQSDYASWMKANPEGTMSYTGAESLRHPLDIVGWLTKIEVPDKLHTISFTFTNEPGSFTVRYWQDLYAGKPEAYDIMYENLKVIGNSIALPQGDHGYVFQVHAMWPKGYANYEFYLVPSMRFSEALK